MQGLNFQPLHLPFAAGLMQKSDDRARQPPALDIALDVQFDELGGVQTRCPFVALGDESSDFRRCFANGDELLVFTKTQLLSWNQVAETWVEKGTHLAVKVAESPVFVTSGDQLDCDRAELGGVIIHVWTEASTGGCLVAATDKATGAVTLPPTEVPDAVGRCRLVALSTRILLFYTDGDPALRVYALDPLDPADGLGVGVAAVDVLIGGDYGESYDVVRIPSVDAAMVASTRAVTTSYTVAKVTAGLVVTSSTKARTCGGPIALSVTPDGLHVQIVRTATGVKGDLLTLSTFADVFINQDIGPTGAPVQLTCAHRSVQNGGAYRCYVFWNDTEEIGFTVFTSTSNWVDTAGALGTEARFVRRMAVASRAFDYNGEVYFWGVFVGQSEFTGANDARFRAQLQNTLFLYRDDGLLVAKAASFRAGGIIASNGHLPGVVLTSGSTGYSWCGTERRIIDIGGAGKHTGYADQGPRDITFTFDHDDARRCARLGQTLYIAGGEIMAYDGAGLEEVGFHIYPWSFRPDANNTGDIEAASYTYKVTWRWSNARGEQERSTTATSATITIAGATPNGTEITDWTPLYITHKDPVVVEVWRTQANPIDESDFFLATSKDPGNDDPSDPNTFVVNDPDSDALANFSDELSDADLGVLEANPENGGVLENLSPPAASIITANDTRIFLAGVAGDPDRVWYSKQRREGELAAFHEALTCDIPPAGGAITAVAFHNETLVVFRERAVYALPGDGLDNLGSGQNFGPARIVSSDCGAVNQESIALTDRGLVFKSSKGWYLLNKGFGLDYIGAPVSDYDSETVVAVHVLAAQHQVRCLTTERMLVLDTLVNQWSEWTVSDGLHATMWRGSHAYLSGNSVGVQTSTFADLTYGLDVETAWIKPADLQGGVRIRKLMALGEYRSPHNVRVRVAYDYLEDYVDDFIWENTQDVVGGPEQVQIGPSRQRCQAIKVRLTALATSALLTDEVPAPPSGEGLKLTGLAMEVGQQPGLYRRLAATQKAGA